MKTDRILGICFVLFSCLMMTAAMDITDLPMSSGISSRFWPLCVLGMMCFLGAVLAFKGDDDVSLPWGKVATCMVFFIGYVVGLRFFGYIIATFVFQFLFLCFLGIRNAKSIVFSISCTAVLTIIFRVVLHVLLPNGVGIFRTINVLILR